MGAACTTMGRGTYGAPARHNWTAEEIAQMVALCKKVPHTPSEVRKKLGWENIIGLHSVQKKMSELKRNGTIARRKPKRARGREENVIANCINSTNLSFHMETENTMIIWFAKPEGARCTAGALDNTFTINCTIERPVQEDLERLQSAELFENGQTFKGIAHHTSRYEFPCRIGSLVDTPSNWTKNKLGTFHVWEIPKKAALQASLFLMPTINISTF